MFMMKKNQVIITALVIMIAVAGYLNYVDSNELQPGIALTEEGEISTTTFVPNESQNLLTNSDIIEDNLDIAMTENEDLLKSNTVLDENKDDLGTAIFVNSNLNSSYFIQAKLVREQDRSKQKEILTDMINNKNIEQDLKAKYADEMLTIQKRIEKESATEAMIEAKGFKEVYVRVDDDTVDVVVSKEVLTDAEIAQIEDIVTRKTGMDISKIRISPMKK